MRTLSFDQFEFDPPEGEEGLEVAIVTKRDRPFPDLFVFAASMWGPDVASALPEPVAFKEKLGPGNIREYLKQYADLELPMPCEWPTYILCDDWNDWDAIIAGPDLWIRYHWSTSA